MLGGFFAEQGSLNLPLVILLGFIGTFFSEAALFHLGLSRGPALMQRSPRWRAHYEQFAVRLQRHKYLLILGYRFCYGMRSIAPIAIGASGIRPLLFHSLNLVGTLVWTLVVALLGFFFGKTIGHYLEHYLEKTNGMGIWIPALLAFALLAVRLYTSSGKSSADSG